VDAGLALLPADPTCLRRSVTQQRELDRLGLPSALHVGVRRVGDRTEAHAWLQVGSEVVNDQADVVGSYVELAAGDLERLLPSLT
ncbi:MAG: hypothetical protein JWN57_1244, partial [Frankiales bacterium]|nr:hypothetical protein [Frankiales bacterium]